MCDGSTNIIDLVTTVDVAFGGTAPSEDPSGTCPYIRTDVNCDSITNVMDVVLMVNVVYRSSVFRPEFCGDCN